MLLDSHIENRLATPLSLGIPRWNKRIVYYIFKIRYIQFYQKQLSGLPNIKLRKKLKNNYFNEYEVFKIK